MQDAGFELPGIYLLRTWVNKGQGEFPLPGTSVNKPSLALFGQKFIGDSSPLVSNEV
jgi:hypothetical protein